MTRAFSGASSLTNIIAFETRVPQDQVDDLHRRLAAARWPDAETVNDFSQGVQLHRLRALVEHWRNGYDWRRCEAMLNRLGHYWTRIDGLDIHFLHIPSRHDDALPLLLTHGWPGSVIEFSKVINQLADPLSRGGTAADAFHFVIPSLPGVGFSEKPSTSGWTLTRIAAAWAELMRRLGYRRYVAQGGDLGAGVTTQMARARPDGLAAVHLNFPLLFPPPIEGEPTALEKSAMAQLARYREKASGYSLLQNTRPQTLGYALADSPVGQGAWIYEKFLEWSGDGISDRDELPIDDVLDNISLYWFTLRQSRVS